MAWRLSGKGRPWSFGSAARLGPDSRPDTMVLVGVRLAGGECMLTVRWTSEASQCVRWHGRWRRCAGGRRREEGKNTLAVSVDQHRERPHGLLVGVTICAVGMRIGPERSLARASGPGQRRLGRCSPSSAITTKSIHPSRAASHRITLAIMPTPVDALDNIPLIKSPSFWVPKPVSRWFPHN